MKKSKQFSTLLRNRNILLLITCISHGLSILSLILAGFNHFYEKIPFSIIELIIFAIIMLFLGKASYKKAREIDRKIN